MDAAAGRRDTAQYPKYAYKPSLMGGPWMFGSRPTR